MIMTFALRARLDKKISTKGVKFVLRRKQFLQGIYTVKRLIWKNKNKISFKKECLPSFRSKITIYSMLAVLLM